MNEGMALYVCKLQYAQAASHAADSRWEPSAFAAAPKPHLVMALSLLPVTALAFVELPPGHGGHGPEEVLLVGRGGSVSLHASMGGTGGACADSERQVLYVGLGVSALRRLGRSGLEALLTRFALALALRNTTVGPRAPSMASPRVTARSSSSGTERRGCAA